MKQKYIIIISLVLILLLTAGCSSQSGEQSDGQEAKQSQDQGEESFSLGLSSFETMDIKEENKDQDIFKNYSLTLVNVWGTFCGPCIDEMPYLGELQKEYEPQGVNVIGIVVDVQDRDLQVMDDQLELANEIAETTGADYTHLLLSEDMLSVLNEFDAIPASFFVDRGGNIVSEFYIGSRAKKDWVKIIEKNLENR